jgi:hypothetical protein
MRILKYNTIPETNPNKTKELSHMESKIKIGRWNNIGRTIKPV